jgi:hypothetical protein
MWVAPWLRPHRSMDAPRPPSARVLILARTLHPSFSTDLAERLVACLSRRELGQLWDDSTRLVGQSIPDEVRLNVVVLREHLLGRLEAGHPGAFEECLDSGRAGGVTRQRERRP